MKKEHIDTIRRVFARWASMGNTVVHTEEEVFASMMSELEWWAVRGGFAYDEEFLNWKETRALPFFQHMKRKGDPYAGVEASRQARPAVKAVNGSRPRKKPAKPVRSGVLTPVVNAAGRIKQIPVERWREMKGSVTAESEWVHLSSKEGKARRKNH